MALKQNMRKETYSVFDDFLVVLLYTYSMYSLNAKSFRVKGFCYIAKKVKSTLLKIRHFYVASQTYFVLTVTISIINLLQPRFTPRKCLRYQVCFNFVSLQ